MEEYVHVVSITVKQRNVNAPKVNKVLTACGKVVLARMGIHYEKCDVNIITLITVGNKKDIQTLVKKLTAIKGVKAAITSLLV